MCLAGIAFREYGYAMTALREMRMKSSPDVVDGFRMRGCEVTRLESFADAIFAFALTLLIVSLEVPKSFADLINTMRGFPAFAVCFLMLATIWNTITNSAGAMVWMTRRHVF